MPQVWVFCRRAWLLAVFISKFKGYRVFPTHPSPLVIQAWQQIPRQCAGQSLLFLTHGVWAVPCAVGELCMDPPILGTQGLAYGWGGSGGPGKREAVYPYIYAHTYHNARVWESRTFACVYALTTLSGMSQGL